VHTAVPIARKHMPLPAKDKLTVDLLAPCRPTELYTAAVAELNGDSGLTGSPVKVCPHSSR